MTAEQCSSLNFARLQECVLSLPISFWANGISDTVIGASCLTISCAFLYLARKRFEPGAARREFFIAAFFGSLGLMQVADALSLGNRLDPLPTALTVATALASAAASYFALKYISKIEAMMGADSLRQANEAMRRELLQSKESQACLTQDQIELQRCNANLEDALNTLRESEERLALAIDGSRLGLWDWNIKTNAKWFSNRWLEMTGYGSGDIEFTFDTWTDRIHPADRRSLFEALDRHLKSGDRFNPQFRLQSRSSDYVWVEALGEARGNYHKY